ncbi:hypothetical protein GCM10009717_12800 [Agromyces allii]|uniref:Uncharacterized protein n=1 Tax=Agromyces allii TaxID=393607 RepID=A0ABN2Q9R7_9MICO
MAALEHVDRVDLQESEAVEHTAHLTNARPRGRWAPEPLRGERDAAGEWGTDTFDHGVGTVSITADIVHAVRRMPPA